MAAQTAHSQVRISKIANRYLLFDIDAVMYLRRNHNVCCLFTGTMPQCPQQNMFLGLPVELMAEEALLLVRKKIAYVVDDGMFHPARLSSLEDSTRRTYVQSLKDEGRRMQEALKDQHERRRAKVLSESSKGASSKKKRNKRQTDASQDVEEQVTGEQARETEESLFGSNPVASAASNFKPSLSQPIREVTPTTTDPSILKLPSNLNEPSYSFPIPVPPSYPLYAHLQDKGYFMMPGLRFGCDYNVYPGDPLRFHSHFSATSYQWREEISLSDIVTSGRLGTTVKKCALMGGKVERPNQDRGKQGDHGGQHDHEDKVDDEVAVPEVRTFTIEWATM